MTNELALEIVNVLTCRPSAMLTDIDGTISEIADTPDRAVVEPEARRALGQLAPHVDLVGVVTGRTVQNAIGMVDEPRLSYVGNHGLERWSEGRKWTHPDAQTATQSVASALAELETFLESEGLTAGLRFENKGVTGSVHYRLSPQPEEVGSRIETLASQVAAEKGLRMTSGKMVVELRPRIQVNKGTIMVDMVDEYGLKGLVYLGDDRTDVDAFHALAKLRERGLETLSIAVSGKETPAEVVAAADRTISGVTETARLLSRVAEMMESNR